MVSWGSARQAKLLAEFARRRPAEDAQLAQSDKACLLSPYAADEVALALRLSRGTAMVRLEQAQRLDRELSATRQAWQEGRIDLTKVRAVLDATAHLEPAKATAVQDRVLPRATGQTAGQLRGSLARAIISTDPGGAAQRHQRARRDRRVAVHPQLDGMASLWALLSAPDALSAYEWLTRLARGMGAEDPRGMDARRADLLTGLLTGRLTVAAPATTPGATVVEDPDRAAAENADGNVDADADADQKTGSPGGGDGPVDRADHPPQPLPQPVNPGKPLIQVVVPYETLTGAAEHPGDLVGYGPIPAPLARTIAADAVWKRLITDPLSGALLDHGRSTYRPPAALAEFVRARDVHCRHPGCLHRAIDSDLDHAIAYTDGGHTAESNLYGACPHHHRTKHEAPGWSVRQHTDGRISWTTPTGHTYTTAPYDYRIDEDVGPIGHDDRPAEPDVGSHPARGQPVIG
jgi:hypothetical protein